MAVAITTIDNPFNPITEFEQWNRFDFEHQYKTNELLARFCKSSIELSPADYELEIENAIDDVIRVMGDFYKKVYS